MAGPEAELSREVARIVASPYPPSLARLADLCAGEEPLTIRTSLHSCPPCAITRLASTVSAALPVWQHTVVLLRSLSYSLEFTNALLLQNPGLLDALLTRANSSDQAFEQYAELCVTLLSRPLPEALPLPASAQTFFLKAFERAIRDPHVKTLNPVYCMLNGACRGLLSTLPADTRQVFDDTLKHMLSSTNTGQNSMLMLWCFGITILAEHPHATEASAGLRWETASGRKLFGPEVNKTINLAYLNVVWASKGEVGVSDAEALEGIRIATKTVRLIDKEVRERWPSSGVMAKNTFVKLPSKILRKGISPAIQLEALSFYSMIAGKQRLHVDLLKEYEAALPKVLSLVDSDSMRESFSISFMLFAPQMQGPAVRALLSTILRTSISPTSTREIANMHVMVNELTEMLPNCPQLRANVVAALASDDMQETIQRFLQVDVQNSDHGGAQSCQSYAAAMRRALVSATISLCLASVTALALPNSLGMALISRQQQLPFVPKECNHSTSSGSIPLVSLFQQECTPLSGGHLQDWRQRLASELDNHSSYQRDSLIRSVAQICRDLESRCETVEEPLRQEREKSSRLEDEVRELREKLKSVDLRMWENDEHLAALDSENERLEKEKDQLADDLDRLRQDFDDANIKANETLREVEDRYSTAEVQYRSTILAREDDVRAREQDINELRLTLATQEEEVEGLRSTVQVQEDDIRAHKHEIEEQHKAKDDLFGKIDDSREQLRALSDDHHELQAHMADLTRSLETECTNTAALTSEVNELRTKDAKLSNNLQDTKLELVDVTGRLEDAQARHRELAQASTKALEELKRQFDTEMDEATRKAIGEHARMDKDLGAALRNSTEVTTAYGKLQRECDELHATLTSLKAEVHELTDACLARDEDLEELRAWKSNVMESIGFPREPMQRATPRATTDAGNPRTPHQHRRRKSALHTREGASKAPVAMQAVSSTAMENVANVSFTSSDSQTGSIPKRAKPRPSFKVPSMHTPHSNRPLLASKSGTQKSSSAQRAALRPISPNRRHTTVGFAIDENGEKPKPAQDLPLRERRGSFQDVEPAGFNMDDFVAGTPFTPGAFTSGTGRSPATDELTTEL